MEKILRNFEELGDEYKIRLTTHMTTGANVGTLVAEYIDEKTNTEESRDKLKGTTRAELAVTR